jgi:hypothetical protein
VVPAIRTALSGEDHIHLLPGGARADEPRPPLKQRHSGAIADRHLGGIGLNRVLFEPSVRIEGSAGRTARTADGLHTKAAAPLASQLRIESPPA